jgi:hypothetical protein
MQPLPRIQWDEEKCRPIYEHRLSSSLQTQSTESDDDDDKNEEESIFAKNSPSPRIFVHVHNKRQRSNRGVFGGCKKTPRFAVTVMPRHSSSCSVSASDNEEDISLVLVNDSEERQNQVTKKTEKNENDRTLNKIKSKSLDRHENPSEMVNPSKNIRQPGPKTALSVAREFFSTLDKTTLHIVTTDDDTKDPVDTFGSNTEPIHTRRGKLPNEVVRTEYHKYKDACRCANIHPLSQREFLQQRAQFYRPGEIFDGMFDE